MSEGAVGTDTEEQCGINYAALSQPFSVHTITWKPQTVSKDKTRAMAVPYGDVRAYEDRLNAVHPDWSSKAEFSVAGSKVVCTVHLTVCGITRTGDGEADLNDQNVVTAAYAQAWKRACSRFQLGRYLYDFPKCWVGYDASRKMISWDGIDELNHKYEEWVQAGVYAGNALAGTGNGSNGATAAPDLTVDGARAIDVDFGKHRGETLGQVFDADPSYVEWLSREARNVRLRAAAVLLVGGKTKGAPAEAAFAPSDRADAQQQQEVWRLLRELGYSKVEEAKTALQLAGFPPPDEMTRGQAEAAQKRLRAAVAQSVTGGQETGQGPRGITDPQRAKIVGLMGRLGYDTPQAVDKALAQAGFVRLDELTLEQASEVISRLDRSVKQSAGEAQVEPRPKADAGDPASVILNFGKHRDKTLGEVFGEEPSYVEWLARSARVVAIKNAAQAVLAAAA